MSLRGTAVALAGILMTAALPGSAQQAAVSPDSASGEIRKVLRAFYFNLARQDWEALGAYVLSPKLLERRPAPGTIKGEPGKRARAEASSRTAAQPVSCSGIPAMVDQAVIRLDGDWAEVSVPRCGASAGTDEFRLLYFEERWRFIYTALFEPTNVSADR